MCDVSVVAFGWFMPNNEDFVAISNHFSFEYSGGACHDHYVTPLTSVRPLYESVSEIGIR